MNRIVARRVIATIHAFKVPTRGLTSAQQNSENKEKLGSINGNDQYDIAIVGGDTVGMALACALSSSPLTKKLSVAIIDSNPALGKEVNIKKDDLPDPRVWDYTGLGYTRYTASDVDADILGCVVENKVLHSSLLSCLQNTDFQKTIYPSKLTTMAVQPNTPTKGIDSSCSRMAKLELSDGQSLFAKLVVGADGGKSHVRELARIKTTGWNYSQNAIICTVKHTVENHCAWQRFLPSGPIALLPIGDEFSNIVWTMIPKEATERKSMSEDDFVKAVNHALHDGYGPNPQSNSLGYSGDYSWEVPPKVVELTSERMVFPLSLKHANEYVVNRVVLIGDATHTVHPLAGQGVNLGFGDACALSKIIYS